MTKSIRTRLVAAVSAFAVLAAGAVLTAQAFSAEHPAGTQLATAAEFAVADDATAITMTDWTETNVRGSVVRPPIIRRTTSGPSLAPLRAPVTPPRGVVPPRTAVRPPVIRR